MNPMLPHGRGWRGSSLKNFECGKILNSQIVLSIFSQDEIKNLGMLLPYFP